MLSGLQLAPTNGNMAIMAKGWDYLMFLPARIVEIVEMLIKEMLIPIWQLYVKYGIKTSRVS